MKGERQRDRERAKESGGANKRKGGIEKGEDAECHSRGLQERGVIKGEEGVCE